MGQSTMSAALSRLRTLFQDELLVRVGRDYELTPLARQVLPQVQRTLPLIAQALGQEERFDPGTARRIFRLRLTDYAGVELRPLFALAQAAAPGLQTLADLVCGMVWGTLMRTRMQKQKQKTVTTTRARGIRCDQLNLTILGSGSHLRPQHPGSRPRSGLVTRVHSLVGYQ